MSRWAGWVLTATFLLAAGCESAKVPSGELAPDFELKDLSGNAVRLTSLRGHPVFIDFWATWCGPCQISIPLVQQFYARYKDEGLEVLGLNVDDDPSGVIPFVKHFGMQYPVLYAGASSVYSDYQIDGLPTFFFVDAQGRVVKRFDGFSPEMVETWEAIAQTLLAKSG
jgi:thiol-disulfide isomerase/thioredoxin